MTWRSYAQVLTSPGEAAGVRDHGRLKRSTGFPKVSTIIIGYIIVPEGDHDFHFPSRGWDTIHHIIISALLSLIMSTIVGNIWAPLLMWVYDTQHFKWCRNSLNQADTNDFDINIWYVISVLSVKLRLFTAAAWDHWSLGSTYLLTLQLYYFLDHSQLLLRPLWSEIEVSKKLAALVCQVGWHICFWVFSVLYWKWEEVFIEKIFSDRY